VDQDIELQKPPTVEHSHLDTSWMSDGLIGSVRDDGPTRLAEMLLERHGERMDEVVQVFAV
jgi:hypothetical protein